MISIRDKYDCVGCMACVNRCPVQCIAMEYDEEGFLYPHVDKSRCINCGLCEKVCPVLHLPEKHKEKKVLAAYFLNDNVRKASSSGGMFSALAQAVLSEGGLVFGGAFDKNFRVIHKSVDTEENMVELRGSKYVQSYVGGSFKEAENALKKGRKVLYSGTGCQIAGLKRFLMKDYPGLVTVDLVCHGVPSPKVFAAYKKAVEMKLGGETENMKFRDKKTGWTFSSLVFSGADGKEISVKKKDSLYMKAFLRNLITRPSCLPCRYNNRHSSADITIADFWGIEHVYPDWNDDKGVTLVMLQTDKGEELFSRAAKGNAVVREATFEQAAEYNFAVKKGSEAHVNREKFFADFRKLQIEDVNLKDLNFKEANSKETDLPEKNLVEEMAVKERATGEFSGGETVLDLFRKYVDGR